MNTREIMTSSKYPRFRKKPDGSINLNDTYEAKMVKKMPRPKCPLSTLEQLERNACERVRARKGDVSDRKDVLGEYVLQFGTFIGQRFLWMMENSPGYVGWLIHQMNKEEGKDHSTDEHKDNKAALKQYIMMFEDGRQAVRKKIAEIEDNEKKKAKPPVGLKSLLVGPTLPKEVLDRRIRKMLSPSKFTPNIPSREDQELVACLEEYESSRQASQESTVGERADGITTVKSKVGEKADGMSTVKSKVKRSLFQQTETTLAPAAKQKTRPHRGHVPSTVTCEQFEQSAPVQKEQPSSRIHIPVNEQSEPLQELSAVTSSGLATSLSASSDLPLLYEGWRSTLPTIDHYWVSKAFFGLNDNNKIRFKTEQVTQLWFEPPQPNINASTRNRVQRFFAHRMFLWMPVNLWGVQLHCPHKDPVTKIPCSGILTRSGMHQKTRLVLDIDSYYTMASEYLSCSKCGKKLVAWAHNILSQLDEDRQLLFPCILTMKLACDRKIVHLLRQRGLGNSSSSIHKLLEEAHADRYLRNTHHYLTGCRTYKSAGTLGLISTTSFEEPPVRKSVPGYRWLMKIYQLDVLQRIDFIKASITSLFGTVLKIDSTKKITKKLAGRSAKTLMWATNVGNEHGQVIMTVMTCSEGQGLSSMIQGLCARFQTAQVPPPRILYVDRDCCGPAYIGKYFKTWPFLLVRLDIWHFMRRLSVGCTTDAHPLYGTFMSRLSHCIFKWEEEDVTLLKTAKKAEMLENNILNPSDEDVLRRIKTDELALHCRRMTRGTQETTTLITQLIESLDGDKSLDIQGVSLLDSVRMKEIWAKQSHHVACLQDPENAQLYTRVGTIKKGGMELPKYRCARGSTSLESFHLHMNRFIPGTLASDINFQVYVLDGVHRWNQDRKRDATAPFSTQEHLSYDGELRDSVNKLSNEVLGRPICQDFSLPGKYTGELIGLEYLYSQSTGASVEYDEVINSMEEDVPQEEEPTGDEDEGFEELIQVQDLTVPPLQQNIPIESRQPSRPLLRYPTDEDYRSMINDPGLEQSEHDAKLTPASTASTQSETRQQLSPVTFNPQSIELTQASTVGELSETRQEQSPATIEPESIYDDIDIGPDNIPGYKHVKNLATFLCSLRDQTDGLSTAQANNVIQLWDALSDYDKKRSQFLQRYSSPGAGRFRSPKKMVALGVTSIERAVLGPNPTRANWPNCNRYVETTVEQLVQAYPSDLRTKGKPAVSRWNRIAGAYGRIQALVNDNFRVIDLTEIQLPSLNKTTITQWYNKKGKERDKKILLQGLELPRPPMTGTGAPAPKVNQEALQAGQGESFMFTYPPDTAGMAKLKVRQSKISKSPVFQPILPKPTVAVPSASSDFGFPFVATPYRTSTEVQQISKEDKHPEVIRRKYTRTATNVKCPKCNQDRLEPDHKQYMGYRYCAQTETISFEQWRENLKARGAARKRKL